MRIQDFQKIKNNKLIDSGHLGFLHKRSKKHKKKIDIKKIIFKVFFAFIFLILFGFLFGLLVLLGLVSYYSQDLPNIDEYFERNKNLGKETIIYDRNEIELYRLRGDIVNERLKYEEVPYKLEAAVLAAEDANFRSHKGLDIFGLARALSCVATNYIQGKSTQNCPGGSSITQQLIKKTTSMEEKTYERKIKEMILAMKIEEEFSKDRILEFYMNIVPQGREYVGIKTGAIYLFGKSDLNQLSLAEIAYLAGIPNNPEVFSPRGSVYNPILSLERANYVLNRLKEEKDKFGITDEEIEIARSELPNVKFVKDEIAMKAPHFVNQLIAELDKEYADKVNSGQRGSDYFRDKGYKIISTVDLNIQNLLEKIIKERIESQEFQQMAGAQTAAAVVVDNKTGEVIALMGSKDYFADSNDKRFSPKFNSATAPRSMGSSVKPILYMTMFTKGYNPRSILPDLPLNHASSGKSYIPNNYSRTFRNYVDPRTGKGDFITIRQALRYSLNQPAVSGLSMIGVEAFADMYVRLTGNESLRSQFKGVSAALGAANMPLLDHVHAYSTIADYGNYKPLKYILEIRDSNNNIIFDNKQVKSTKVLDSKYTVLITNLNEDYFFFANSPSVAEIRKKTDFAGKTGTSDTSTAVGDIVFIGYTPTVTVGLWAGNSCAPEECPLKPNASSERLFELVYAPFMKEYVKLLPSERFRKNVEGVIRANICSLTGNLANDDCVKAGGSVVVDIVADMPKTEYMIEKVRVTQCNGVIKLARDVDNLVEAAYDKYYVRYDKIFKNSFISDQVYKYLTTGLNSLGRNWIYNDPIPSEYCDIPRNTNPPVIEVFSPINGNNYLSNSSLNVNFVVTSEIPLSKIELVIDNQIVNVFNPGDNLNFNVPLSSYSLGTHKLKIIATNVKGTESSKEVNFNIVNTQ